MLLSLRRLERLADIVFAGMLAFLSWSYAAAGNRLVDAKDVNPELAKFMRHQALAMLTPIEYERQAVS